MCSEIIIHVPTQISTTEPSSQLKKTDATRHSTETAKTPSRWPFRVPKCSSVYPPRSQLPDPSSQLKKTGCHPALHGHSRNTLQIAIMCSQMLICVPTQISVTRAQLPAQKNLMPPGAPRRQQKHPPDGHSVTPNAHLCTHPDFSYQSPAPSSKKPDATRRSTETAETPSM